MSDCLFCSAAFQKERIIDSYCAAYVIDDGFPVTLGHKVIIPFKHRKDFFDLSMADEEDIFSLLYVWRDNLLKEDDTITGFNIGWNCGEAAGQTIMHAHVHLIPRRDRDMDDPTGGVRNVIPKKGNYKNGEW